MAPRPTVDNSVQLPPFNRVNQHQIWQRKPTFRQFTNLAHIIFSNFIGSAIARLLLFIGQISQHKISILVCVACVGYFIKRRSKMHDVYFSIGLWLSRFFHKTDKTDKTASPQPLGQIVLYILPLTIARSNLCLYRKGWEVTVLSVLLSWHFLANFTKLGRKPGKVQP